MAHSFGTYLVAETLKRNPGLRLHRLIFCGSVVKRNYDWDTLFLNKQVLAAINDCGTHDVWPILSRIFIIGTGDSGVFGFDYSGDKLQNRFFRYYQHSSYFNKTHITTYWWPFLSSATVNPGPKPVPNPSLLARLLIKVRWAARALSVLLIILLVMAGTGVEIQKAITAAMPSFFSSAEKHDIQLERSNWNKAVRRLIPLVVEAQTSNGGCRLDIKKPDSQADPWNTAQCLSALLSVVEFVREGRVDFRKGLEYLISLSANGMWPAQNPLTEVTSWVGLAFLASPEPFSARLQVIYNALSNRQSPTGGWSSYGTANPRDSATAQYGTNMALTFLLRFKEIRANDFDLDRRALDKHISDGLTKILSEYNPGLKGWEDSPGEGLNEDLATLHLLLLTYAKRSGFEFVESDLHYRNIRNAWLEKALAEGVKRKVSNLGVFAQRQEFYDESSKSRRSDKLPAKFVWYPWSLLLVTYMSSDKDLNSSEREINSRIAAQLWKRLPEMTDAVGTQTITFIAAETLYALGLIGVEAQWISPIRAGVGSFQS